VTYRCGGGGADAAGREGWGLMAGRAASGLVRRRSRRPASDVPTRASRSGVGWWLSFARESASGWDDGLWRGWATGVEREGWKVLKRLGFLTWATVVVRNLMLVA
jgi:hypothetical protein